MKKLFKFKVIKDFDEFKEKDIIYGYYTSIYLSWLMKTSEVFEIFDENIVYNNLRLEINED